MTWVILGKPASELLFWIWRFFFVFFSKKSTLQLESRLHCFFAWLRRTIVLFLLERHLLPRLLVLLQLDCTSPTHPFKSCRKTASFHAFDDLNVELTVNHAAVRPPLIEIIQSMSLVVYVCNKKTLSWKCYTFELPSQVLSEPGIWRKTLNYICENAWNCRMIKHLWQTKTNSRRSCNLL